jgi:hypothetical protein
MNKIAVKPLMITTGKYWREETEVPRPCNQIGHSQISFSWPKIALLRRRSQVDEGTQASAQAPS